MTAFLSLLATVLPAAGPMSPAPDPDGSYFKVEARGRLTVTFEPNGKKVRSVDFTCPKFTIFGHIDVVLPDKKDLHEQARKLHGQMVIITGRATLVEEPPMGRAPLPGRFFLFVEGLQPATKAK
jgi:hypothetical protein